MYHKCHDRGTQDTYLELLVMWQVGRSWGSHAGNLACSKAGSKVLGLMCREGNLSKQGMPGIQGMKVALRHKQFVV